MLKALSAHVRANVIGCFALFLVLCTGSAVALNGSNTVFSDDIVDGQVQTADLGANAVTSSKIKDGEVKIADLAGGGYWRLAGNAGTTGSNFLGTTDNKPLNLRVNNVRALRLEPVTDFDGIPSPNVIGGSADNRVTPGVFSATIGGGGRGLPSNPATGNRVTDRQGTVGGGVDNQAGNGPGSINDAPGATVGGGFSNTAGYGATVAGGSENVASGSSAGGGGTFVGGGLQNTASGANATVAGGDSNTASDNYASVGGGNGNSATGKFATVPGGWANIAQGDFSLAAGTFARADHQGAFVWADSNTTAVFGSTAQDQFSVRATGGARFVSAIDGSGNPTAGVTLASGGGSWASLSDRASKTAITPVSGRGVLRKLGSVPISEWSYRAQGPSIRHIGPMAQDLSRAFGVGEDPRHIDSVDADGISLAAIKALNQKVRVLQGRIGVPAGDSVGPSGEGPSVPMWLVAMLAGLGLAASAAVGATVALRWQRTLGQTPAAS